MNNEVSANGTQLLRFKNVSDNEDPKFAHDGDSGFDLRAWIRHLDMDGYDDETDKYFIILKPFERRLVHTGLYFNLPPYTELQVRPRSGAALKQGLSVLNTPGTVDSMYTNEVGVIAVNLSNKEIRIYSGDRIAQAVLMPVFNSELTDLVKVDEIDENDSRNKNGFGSTGFQ